MSEEYWEKLSGEVSQEGGIGRYLRPEKRRHEKYLL